jgi:hypothetical protein
VYLEKNLTLAALVCAGAIALSGCPNNGGQAPANNASENNGANNTAGSNNAINNPNGTNNTSSGERLLMASSRPRVKFRGGARWGRDLGQALGLEPGELCNELGRYDCVGAVHRITLGGVEPYSLGIDEPVETAPVIAPMAADRVALSACDVRAERDLADVSGAVLFKEMPADGAPDAAAREAMGTRLVEKILRREARADEVAELVAFWDEVLAEEPEDPRRDWATLTCFSLATSTEALFY